MKYQLIIAKSVYDNLEKIIEYYTTINVAYTNKIIVNLNRTIVSISTNPYLYPKLDYFPIYRKAIILKRFLLIYRINSNQIEILHFVDGISNYPRLLS